MKVKFSSEGAPANELELERLRRKMGAEPPSDYLDFLKARNGCRVETNVFRVNETNDAGVNASLDVDAVIDEKAALGARLSRHTRERTVDRTGIAGLKAAAEMWQARGQRVAA